jgi:hypothetical protein
MLHANLSINVLGVFHHAYRVTLPDCSPLTTPDNHVPRNGKAAFGRSFCLLVLLIGKSPASRTAKN